MTNTIYTMDDLPVVVAGFPLDFKFGQEIREFDSRVSLEMDRAGRKIYYLVDTTNLILKFEDIMQGIQVGIRGDRPTVKHPNVIKTLLVAQDGAVKLIAKSLNTVTFGSLDVLIYDTLDEALAYVRAQVASSAE